MDIKTIVEMFEKTPAAHYDERHKHMAPIRDNLAYSTELILSDLPENSEILCVGVGTGFEIVDLARAYPKWKFTGIDPSKNMLEGCRTRIKEKGIEDRCELFHGFLSDYPKTKKFDAVLCILVLHFFQDQKERQETINEMAARLKNNGYLVIAELSYDLDSPQLASILEPWKILQLRAGGTKENIDKLPEMMRTNLGVLPPAATEKMLKVAGFLNPIQFFQSFIIFGWFAKKS